MTRHEFEQLLGQRSSNFVIREAALDFLWNSKLGKRLKHVGQDTPEAKAVRTAAVDTKKKYKVLLNKKNPQKFSPVDPRFWTHAAGNSRVKKKATSVSKDGAVYAVKKFGSAVLGLPAPKSKRRKIDIKKRVKDIPAGETLKKVVDKVDETIHAPNSLTKALKVGAGAAGVYGVGKIAKALYNARKKSAPVSKIQAAMNKYGIKKHHVAGAVGASGILGMSLLRKKNDR